MTKLTKTIYISHMFGGKQENVNRCENIIKQLIKQYPDFLFISPLHALGFLYDYMDYDKGMEHCLALLSLCDECWVISEPSKGVLIEIDYCNEHNIPVYYKLR